jgi:hypothetical protein
VLEANHVLQAKSLPTAEQVRDNQRRSRARHKEFVDDLKKRVQEYERKGVEVTKEIQQTARKVHADNIKLRQLLDLKGVPEAEVNAFLIGPEASNSALPPARGIVSPNQTQTQTLPVDSHQPSPRPSKPPVDNRQALVHILLPPESIPDHPIPERLPHHSQPSMGLSSAESRNQPSEPTTSSASPLDLNHDQQDTNFPQDHTELARYIPLANSTDDKPLRSPLETSCEDAANIIASMRGHADKEQVRDELGCSGREQCQVKNTTLFHVMDRS